VPIDLFLLAGIITPLACARIWRLAAKDEVSWWLRKRLIFKLPDTADGRQHWILRGVDCPFCLGFWINAIAIPVVWFWHPAPVVIALAVLAGSHITGLAQKG
jgi:hypothetical protein